MGFSRDTPVVAGTVLIRTAIQSPNYVAGVSGWTINADGSVEFANITARGTFIVDGTGNSFVRIAASGGVPQITFRPSNLTGYATYNSNLYTGIIQALSVDGGNQNASYSELDISAPGVSGGSRDTAQIRLVSSTFDDTTGPLISFGRLLSVGQPLSVLVDGSLSVNGANGLSVPTGPTVLGSTLFVTGLINGGYTFQQRIYFTANSSFIKANFIGTKAAFIKMVGGGGGGGGAGATAGNWAFGDGGGAGEYAEGFVLTSAMAASETITIGTGGAGGVGASNGATANITSFGSTITANGGGGGAFRAASLSPFSGSGNNRSGGTGGTGGTFRVPGGSGGSGIGVTAATAGVRGGDGGQNLLSGAVYSISNGAGQSGAVYGGGGSGASSANGGPAATGGTGADGIVIMDLYG
jgi:hypothetical protein